MSEASMTKGRGCCPGDFGLDPMESQYYFRGDGY